MRRALCAVALLALAGCGGTKALRPASWQPVVVLQSPSASGWTRMLRASGYAVYAGGIGAVLGPQRTGAVVPADASLSAEEVSRLAAWVKNGGRVATANAALLRALGIDPGSPVSQRGANDAAWARLWDVTPPTGKGLNVLVRSQPGGNAAIAEKRLGAGLAIAFSIDPVGAGRTGWELFPDAPHIVGRDLGAPPGPHAVGAHMFLDPGGLPRSVEYAYSKIADMAARSGTRVAEIAAWNYDFTDPRNDYPYGKLIDALHARGILAYAWLEPPFVTLRLYQDHPECREKTATGRDAVVGWRSLIALEDPACMTLAQESWRRILTRFPWDGVNVAELYFEPIEQGLANYTPFSASALAQCGCDPKTQRSKFLDWRTQEATKLNQQVLRFVSGLPNAAHIGMELTVIDDTLDPVLGRSVGNDVRALAHVAEHAGASLIVEDPTSTWAKGPFRYDRLGPHVSKIIPPSAALLDVNIVKRYGAHPTAQARGAEFAMTIESAAASFGKVGIYALGTLTPADLAALPGALAGATSTTDLGVYGKWTILAEAPSPTLNRLTVDGIPWPADRGTAVVPAGNHVLQWSKGPAVGPGLVWFTGQLGTARVGKTRLSFTYDSRPDAYAIVTRKPTSLTIDGKPARLEVAGTYAVRLPTGTHKAVLTF